MGSLSSFFGTIDFNPLRAVWTKPMEDSLWSDVSATREQHAQNGMTFVPIGQLCGDVENADPRLENKQDAKSPSPEIEWECTHIIGHLRRGVALENRQVASAVRWTCFARMRD